MAGVAVRKALQIVLMLRLGLPERTCRGQFGDHFAWPQPRRVDVGDGVFGHGLLLCIRIKNCRTVTGAEVVALAVRGARVVDLEEEFQDLAVAEHGRIEADLDRLGMAAVVTVGCIIDIAAAVADAGGQHSRHLADQVLHAPEATAGQDGLFRVGRHNLFLSVNVPAQFGDNFIILQASGQFPTIIDIRKGNQLPPRVTSPCRALSSPAWTQPNATFHFSFISWTRPIPNVSSLSTTTAKLPIFRQNYWNCTATVLRWPTTA